MDTARVRLLDVRYYLRNVKTRMPFRYGVAHLVGYPIFHARVTIETENGKRAEGVAADALPPKWFDKNPAKDFKANVDDLLAVTHAAERAYLSLNAKTRTPFELFREGYAAVVRFADENGLNHLTAGFGSAIFERAVVDAVGNALGLPYHDIIRQNRLGINMGSVHAELAGIQPGDVVPPQPLDSLWIRHTVGLSDPITDADIPDSERLNDGLPQSLEDYVLSQRIRYFKIKVCGNTQADLDRLEAIAGLLDTTIPDPYYVSLDGNEQYKEVDAFVALVETLQSRPHYGRFFESILFIEQPLERSIALNEDAARELPRLSEMRPVIIDESDCDLDTFKHAAELGYRGVSAKNCKGIYKSLMNFTLTIHFTKKARRGETYFLTGEDLTNVPIVPLQQDLTTLATLGVTHAERNGHHYLRGLLHLSDSERAAVLNAHPTLYAVKDGLPQLNIQKGRVHFPTIHAPGYGLGVPIDFGSMTPLEQWTFESLGV